MTVSTNSSRISHDGNGVTTVFAFPYKFIATSDIKVYVNGVLQASGYTVGTPSDSGANVTFSVAPAVAATIVFVNDPDVLQSTALPGTGPFPSKSVETMADKLTLIAQRLKDLAMRSFTLADGDASTASLTLPTPGANQLVGWNSTATGLQNVDPASLLTIAGSSGFTAETFNGTGAQTAFTLSTNPGTVSNLEVFISGVRQTPTTDYTFSGTTLTFVSAPAAGTGNILVRWGQTLGIGVPSDASVTAAKFDPSVVTPFSLTALAAATAAAWRTVLGGAASGANSDITSLSGLTGGISSVTSINGGSLSGFRNRIIGGDFSTNPWQRGTTFTALADSAYGPDRWFISRSNDGVVDIFKTADAPTAAQAGVYTQHCLHADVTTADTSIAAGQYYMIVQIIEGYNAKDFGFGQSGTRYVTLSFWHKHTVTGTYCVGFKNSAADRSYVAEYTQSVADTWEKASVTIPVDTTGTWLYDSGRGMVVTFTVASGSTYQTTANAWAAGNFFATSNQVNGLSSITNNFKIALVQLEPASSSTFTGSTFEQRPYGTELALCQRYYQTSYVDVAAGSVSSVGNIGIGFTSTSITNSQVLSTIVYPVEMRTSPTGTVYSPTTGASGKVRSNGAAADVSVTPTVTRKTFYVAPLTGVATTDQSFVYHYTASAEL